MSGRTESLKYGYYFAIPYAKKGCNILVLDPRAHGLSDGRYNTVGFEESGDDIAWANFLVNELNQQNIVFHGICIGAAGGMLAITNENCPKEVKAIITEGMFPNFNESMKNNLCHLKKPVYIHKQINRYMIKYTGHSMMVGPINYIEKLDRPLLMLHSREDHSSKPEYVQKLFDLAGTKDKEIVWFEHGRHSFMRITDTPSYDEAIAKFLEKHNLV